MKADAIADSMHLGRRVCLKGSPNVPFKITRIDVTPLDHPRPHCVSVMVMAPDGATYEVLPERLAPFEPWATR